MDALTYWLKHRDQDQAKVIEMCRRAGTSLAYFKQIAYQHRSPSPRKAQAFVRASGNILTLELLLFPPRLPRQVRSKRRKKNTDVAEAA